MATKTTNVKAAEKKTDVVDQEKTADAKPTEKKPAAPKVEIIRGRMPLPIVHMIKFGTEGETDGAVATKFRTTNGKVSDVRKDRNFGYIKKDATFSQAMIDGAIAYAEQLDDKSILKAVKAIKADDAADANMKEARSAGRPAKAEKAGDKKPAEKASEKVSDSDLDGLTA